ncbi:MAG: hypothetical protein EOM40_09630 [Clostridia bacterium]|nr:hypothetical protein [Clostridia bacterium]NCC42953.1 hypothetical protein [Clostridia bacterium]
MLALRILELKDFTAKLFLGETFHRFSFVEASFTTFITHTLDGLLQKEFFDSEDCPDRTYCYWEDVKPQCYSIIKGKKSPLRFKIVFQLAPENVKKLLEQSHLSMQPEDVFGLYLNCQFNGEHLLCTTGTSVRIFTLDKTLDRTWDDMIKRFFKQQGLLFEEV